MGTRAGILSLILLAAAVGARADLWSDSYRLEAEARYGAAAALFDPLVKHQPTDEFALLRRAWLHYLGGNYNQSQSDYRRALQLNPQSLDARIGLCLPLLAQSRWKETAIAANEALEVAPWNYYAHLRLLVAEEGLKQWQTLLEHAETLHRRYPSDATALVYQARAHLWLGNRKAAAESYRQVLQRIPGHIEASQYLAR